MRAFAAVLGLRYRLVWAHARSRRGRIVLFVLGAVVLALTIAGAALGGFAAAVAAIQQGRGELVARVILTAVFVVATAAGVFFGVEGSRALSDGSLRRYPIGRAARLMARHATALLEPLWLIALAVVCGLAIGLSVSGAGRLDFGLAAAVLFVLNAYLAAVVTTALLEGLLSRPGGALIVTIVGTAAMIAMPVITALLARDAAGNGRAPGVAAALALTPGFATAAVIHAGDTVSAVRGTVVLALGCGLLGFLAIRCDTLPRRISSRPSETARWDHPCDRLAAAFGPLAPLAGKMLRYYVRSPQVRYNFPLALPVLVLMVAGNAPDDTASGMFLFALGAAPATGFLATGAFATNVFGFDGQGFQRYFLLPVSTTRVIVVAALVGLMPGLLIVATGIVVWWFLSPPGATAAMALLLLAAAVGGLLMFHGLGLWTSIVAPRAIPFSATFGNKLSAPANLLFVAVMAAFFGLPWVASQAGLEAVMRAWWVLPCFLSLALVFYWAMLRWAGAAVERRRERMLENLEGV